MRLPYNGTIKGKFSAAALILKGDVSIKSNHWKVFLEKVSMSTGSLFINSVVKKTILETSSLRFESSFTIKSYGGLDFFRLKLNPKNCKIINQFLIKTEVENQSLPASFINTITTIPPTAKLMKIEYNYDNATLKIEFEELLTDFNFIERLFANI